MTDIVNQDIDSTTDSKLDCMDTYDTFDLNGDGEVEVKEAVQYILHSKTIWVNLIAMLSFFIQNKYGFLVDQVTQLELLSMINVGLRTISKKRITLTKKK